eukprot:5301178-Pyramimonas_sp.AAC.1
MKRDKRCCYSDRLDLPAHSIGGRNPVSIKDMHCETLLPKRRPEPVDIWNAYQRLPGRGAHQGVIAHVLQRGRRERL